MCEPISVTTATMIAISAASTVAGGVVSYMQTQAANKAADYNAAIMNRNAEIARMEGENAVKKGEIEAKQHDLKVRQVIASQRAGFAGAGVQTDSGSALDATVDTATYGALDSLTIKRNAAVEQWRLQNQATDYEAQGALTQMSKQDPFLAGGSTILTSGGNLASQYLYKKLS